MAPSSDSSYSSNKETSNSKAVEDPPETVRQTRAASKRRHEAVSNQASVVRSEPKRQKRSVEDDLICPITHELPFDPVTALDGQVYEREAIENYFHEKGELVKSPMTSQPIAKTLLPAPRHRNTIETLVENGVITGDLADKWKERAKQKKQVEELLRKADKGDLDAMEQVALGYDGFGLKGFKKEPKKAFHWYQKLHSAGSVMGTAKVGEYLLAGIGVFPNRGKGAYYLGLAIGKGSDLAARIMGSYFADGDFGLGVDEEEAENLLEMAISNNSNKKIVHLNDEGKREAQEELDQLRRRQQHQQQR